MSAPGERALTWARVLDAFKLFWDGAPGQPCLVARVLKPAFDMLSIEVRLSLARDVMIDLAATAHRAKQLWGDTGNVVVDGNEIRVGVGSRPTFEVYGRGRTYDEAFEDAARRGH